MISPIHGAAFPRSRVLRTTVLLLMSALLVPACSAFRETPVGAHTEENPPLSGDDLTALLADSTLVHTGFTEYLSQDGAVRGRTAELSYDGQWWVEADRFCASFPSHDFKACADAHRVGNHLVLVYDDGNTTTAVIEDGNTGAL